MQAYAEGFDLFDKCEFELDNAKIAHLWGQGSVVRSWLCELAARAFEADGNELEKIEGYTEDSGEGRWTIEDATAHDVPTPVITASLYARLRSRGNGDFADRVLAALRNQFGGHAVKSAPAGQVSGELKRARAPVAARREQAGRVARGRRPAEPRTRSSRARAPAGRADDARDLRRDRRSGQAQTAARALQPRPRGRAARALPPGGRLAQRERERGLPRGVRAGDPPASRGARPTRTCCGASSRTSSTCPGNSTRTPSTQSSTGARRARPAGRGNAQSRLLPVDRPQLLPADRRAARRAGLARHDEPRCG